MVINDNHNIISIIIIYSTYG